MIEELFDQTFDTMTENNKAIDCRFRLMAKAMFLVGFGDCYHYIMQIMKQSDPVTGLVTLAQTGTEINEMMKQMEKDGVLTEKEERDPIQTTAK